MEERDLLNEVLELVGPKGDRWVLEESLRDRAEALVEKFSEDLGHIDLQRVVFVRAIGVNNGKWLGECRYVGSKSQPTVYRHIIASLVHAGLLDLTSFVKSQASLLDPRYVITLNDSAIRAKVGAGEESEKMIDILETITLYHEMLHIKPGMDGNLGHDTQDFSKVLHKFGVFWTQGIIGPSGVGLSLDDASDYVQGLNNLGLTPGQFPQGGSQGSE